MFFKNETLLDVDFFGPDAVFSHVGIAVQKIPDEYRNLHFFCDIMQKVNVAFVNLNGITVEFIEPLNETSPVKNLLRKGMNVYHLCYKVKNLENSINHAKDKGFFVIAEPTPAVAFRNNLISWLYHNNYGIYELVENGD